MTKKTMFPIAELSDFDVAFPASVKSLMPKYEDIPREYRDFNSKTKWNQMASDWFFRGLKNLTLTPKEGVDQRKAMRHIKAIIGSFEPKHEHKEAACAYLLSQWFEDAKWERAK